MARFAAALRALFALLLSRPIRVTIRSATGKSAGFFHPRHGVVLPAIAGGAPDPDPDDDKDKDKDKPDPDDDKDKDDPDPDDDDDKVSPDDDWKEKSRKNESRAKRERKAREEAERKLREREDEDKSESEKALDEAKKKGREEAESEAAKERKGDRLEVAVTRLAAKGLKVGDGDDAETKRFADAEDALLNVEKAIRSGDIDEDDVFDDQGKVNTDALKDELVRLLERKPHLAAGETERDPGDPDTRKGDKSKNDLESMSPEDHAKRKYGKDN